jgi:Tol biopolymer transport system component
LAAFEVSTHGRFSGVHRGGGNRSNARLQFSASQNGVIAYVMGANGAALQLTWFDRSGRALGTVGPPGSLLWGTISPDGNTVAFDRQDPQTNLSDVWLHDLTRGTDSRFTFNSYNTRFPMWSPDGGYVAFQAETGRGGSNLDRKAVNGVGPEEVLVKDAAFSRPDDWSRDGRYVILGTPPGRSKTGSDISVLPLAPDRSGDRKPFPYLETAFNESFAKLSPDGRWLAYRSDESKQYEIYVQTFPTPGGKWEVSTNGGGYPVWSKDGKELFFIDRTGRMMAVEVRGGGAKFEAGVPKPLFDTRFPFGNAWYDVSKDGRFLIPTPVGESANQSIMVVVNWTAGLKK